VLAGERLVVGDPLSTDVGWVFPVARAVKNAAGELQAVLVVGTVIESVQEALRVAELPPGSVVRIVSDQRIGIASFPEVAGWVGSSRVASENVARHLRLGEGSEVTDWSDGATRFTGYATAHLAPWMVAVGLPAAIEAAAIAVRLERSVLFSALAIAIGSLIAWMLSGRIIRPLRRLKHDAAILAAGDLSHRTAIASPDEIRKLSDAFNQMASSLERRQNEARESADEVRRAKDTLDAVIDASPLAIVCSDLDRKIMLWNRGAEQIYGYSEAEVIGRAIRIVRPEDMEMSRQMYRRARSGETLPSVEVKRLRKDGSSVDIALSVAPLFGPDGAVRGVAFVHEDITMANRSRSAPVSPLRRFTGRALGSCCRTPTLRSTRPRRMAAGRAACLRRRCGRRRRHAAVLRRNCRARLIAASSSCSTSRRFGLPTALSPAPKRCCAGGIRSAAFSVRGLSSMRSRQARLRRRSADGSSKRRAPRRRHGGRAAVPWGASRSICSRRNCAIQP
jgi:PAS domain S-box-containing protein